MIKERDLLKTFGIEKPKKDQLFWVVWVEADGTVNTGPTKNSLKDREDKLSEVLSYKYYKFSQKGGEYWVDNNRIIIDYISKKEIELKPTEE